jgi:hypothetical protein
VALRARGLSHAKGWHSPLALQGRSEARQPRNGEMHPPSVLVGSNAAIPRMVSTLSYVVAMHAAWKTAYVLSCASAALHSQSGFGLETPTSPRREQTRGRVPTRAHVGR